MSTTIDNRIVEMKFNNKQFESGAKTTLNTLDKLKASLNFDAAAQSLQRGFSNIERTMALDGIAQGVDTISTRFSALGVVGATVLSNLTTQAMGLISKLNGLVINPIIEGGKTRAQNIEHAKFQLEGLKVAWEDIEPDISYGVQDTAYGLDAAATVASQLVASNVQLGDSMKTALRGVSGVAAMTSSSYEEIGHIFTTVAGQGRLMGMQLTQLSMKGINAAATLGEALGKTEAEIRDMVSKGQIDFATFAKAMDDAYGSHAKDANKTFTGALSNTRAALSRIGAKFATPAYDSLRDVLNKLIPVINDFNKAIDPFVVIFTSGLEKASKSVGEFLDNLGVINKVAPNVDKLEDLAKRVVQGEFGNGEERKRQLEALGASYEDVQSKVNVLLGGTEKANTATRAFADIAKNLAKVVMNFGKQSSKVFKSVNGAFSETFTGSGWENLSKFSKKLADISDKLKVTDNHANKLKNTFKGLFGLFKLAGTTVTSVITLLTPLANKASDIFDPLLDKASNFGNRVVRILHAVEDKGVFFSNLSESFNYIRIALELISPALRTFKDNVVSVLTPVNEQFGSFGRVITDFFTHRFTTEEANKAIVFAKLLADIAESFVNVGSGVAKIAASFEKAIVDMFPQVTQLDILKVTRAISEFTQKLIISDKTSAKLRSTFKGVLAVFDIAAQLFSAIIRTLFPSTNSLFAFGSGVASVTGSIGDWLVQLDESLKENDTFYTSIQKVVTFIQLGFEKAKGFVVSFLETYKEVTGEDFKMPTLDDIIEKFDKLKETFSWVPGVLEKFKTGFAGLFSWFDEDEDGSKTKAVETIVGILDKLSTISANLSPGISEFFANFGEAFDKIDFGRMSKIINIGMFIVFLNALIKLRGAISGLFNWNIFKNVNGVLVGTRSALAAWTTDLKYNSYVKIAQAIGILTASLVALSAIDERRLTSAMGAMASLFVELFGAMSLMTNMMAVSGKLTGTDPSKNLITIAGAAVIIATAMSILSLAIAKLGTLEPAQLASGISAVLGLMAAISLMSVALSQKADSTIIQTAGAMVVFSIALNVLAGALAVVGKIENAGSSLFVLFGALMLFGAATATWGAVSPMMLTFAGALAVFSSALVGIGASILLLSLSLKALTDIDGVWQKLAVLIAGLAAISGIAILLGNFGGAIVAGAAGMVILAGALALFVPVIALIGNMDMTTITQGLLGLTSGLILVGGTAALLGNFALQIAAFGGAMILVGGSLIVMAGAFALFLPTLVAFGQMDIASIGKALLVLAGTIVIFAAAGAFLLPLIPSMLTLSGALLLLGVASVAIGGGFAALSVGIALLSTSSASLTAFVIGLGVALLALVKSISAVGLALLDAIEAWSTKIIEVATTIIVGLVVAFNDNLPIIVECGVMLILGILKGIADHLGDILIVAGEIIVLLIYGLGMMAPKIADAGLALIVKLINGMADAIRNNGEPLFNAMQNLMSSLVEFSITALQQLVRNIPMFGNDLYDVLEVAKTQVRELIAGEDMKNEGYDSAKGFGQGFKEGSDDAEEAGSGLGSSIMTGLSSMLPDFSSLGTSMGLDFSTGLGSTDGSTFDAASLLGNSAGTALDLDLSKHGLSSGDSYTSGLLDSEEGLLDATGLLTDSATDGLFDANSLFGDSGSSNGTNYALGLGSQTQNASNAGSKVANSAANSINSKSEDYRTAGHNAGTGFANGLFLDSRAEAYNAGSNLAQVALNAMTQTLDEHSPSKATEAIGGNAGQGYVNGLRGKFEVVRNASKLLAERSMSVMRNAVMNASGALAEGIDVDPVIRPVVDLTDVINGVSVINGLMASRSFSLGNISGSVSVNETSSLLSGAVSEIQKNSAYNSKQIVQSISELRSDVSQLYAAISKMKIVMDSGELVGAIVDPIDSALGQKVVLKGRGV